MYKLWVLPAAALFACGCGTGPQGPPEKKAELKKAVDFFRVDTATAGTLHGKILFHGKKPAPHKISMDTEAACVKAHNGKPVYEETVVVGKAGGLANAFVYIQKGLEGKTFEPSPAPVMLDQHGCMFVPRAIGMQSGQTLDVKNSDAVSHNIHPMPKNGREWNEQQSPNSPDLHRKFVRPEVMIPVKCDVHSWMRSYIGVVEHPYFAVTGEDGTFEMKNVPPGDYTVAVWHEKLGDQTHQVHVANSASAEVDFTYQ
jgi:hypothetical protein